MNERVALITGASSGIGRAAALLFARNGVTVSAIGRSGSELQRLRDDAHGSSGQLTTQFADLTETSHVDRIVAETVSQFGHIDVLVNAAGIIKNGSIETTSLEDWDRMMNINLRAGFYLTRKCVPHLISSRGNIVNVSSITGLRAFPNVLAYCVSKAATDQMTRCTALELAPKGVRVNAVNPGVVVSKLHKRGGMSAADYEEFIDNAGNTHPLGRAGTPDEVADLIYFLASEKASWITGVTYEIDGGRGQTCAR